MEDKKRIYSKIAIILFSALGSTFFGSILYAQNLKETENSKFIAPTLIFSVIYTVLANKLSHFLNIPSYYAYIPVHLIGGLILTGPFWNYQIGSIDNFEKRKIWLPLLVSLMPVGFILFMHFYYSDKNLSSTEFEETTQREMENALYVVHDSTTVFYDIEIPLLSDSYTFETNFKDARSFYNYKDFENGRFGIVCLRSHMSKNDVFGFDLLPETFSELKPTICKNTQFENILCADFSMSSNDSTIVHGSVSLIKVDRTIYHFFTQFVELDKFSADSLSYYLIDRIVPASK